MSKDVIPRSLIDALKAECTLSLPVRVYVRDSITRYSDADGYADISKTGKTYVIMIDSNQDQRSQIDTLLHEWAHLLDWDARGVDKAADHDWHDGVWGKQFARTYRVFEAWEPE